MFSSFLVKEKMKQHKLAIVIAIILFFIPFFWLAPEEMNLGGDSGRLYFYDPAAYLNLHVLYNYLGSGFGVELTYYIYLPFILLMSLFRSILQSPTILISFFNGITLSVAFFSVYLLVKELLSKNENDIKSEYIINFSSIVAGLFYILSQIAIYSGWEKPVLAFNQIFLNPFMAFLILKFMLTQKMKYLVLAIFTTLIFTPNFSIVGAPPFFAFYPITVFFLFLYTKFVRRVSFRWRFFAIGIILFLLIHTFHLVNTIESVFSPGSSYNQTVFADEGEAGSRNGLTYFISVAGTVKLSQIWISLAQYQDKPYLAIFIILPLSLAIAFFINRGKALLLTGLFFLVFFYFSSAITETGFFIYKQFFRIPGFSIFRNFHAQWSYAFFFFYALLLGQSLAIIANKLNKRLSLLFFTIFGAIIVGFSFPLLNGSVPIPIYPQNVRFNFRMDPFIEQVLRYFRSEPVDGRVLMLPLTGPGYQIFQGKDGGVYKGLPTISYLAGKSELGGYETLRPFQYTFLNFMQNNDYEGLKKLFSILNIKWVFYNSDPYIYSDTFSSIYGEVSSYAPKDQNGYKAFIEKLPVTKLNDYGDKYHIYSVNNDTYFPHIFATNNLLYSNSQISTMFDSNFQKDIRQLVGNIESAKTNKDPMIIYGIPKSFLTNINDNNHLHKHVPFLNQKLSSPLYSLAVLREKFDLIRFKKNPTKYIDYSLFLLSKRIAELNTYGLAMPLVLQKSSVWEIGKWFTYNSWSASFNRYEKAADQIINWLNNSNFSHEDKMYYKVKLNEQLSQHELFLLRIIYDLNKETNEKEYLLTAVNAMFSGLYEKVSLSIIDPSLYAYYLPAFANREGRYEVYLQDKDIEDKDQNQITLNLENQVLKVPSKDINLDNKSQIEVSITAPILNLASGQKWKNSGTPIEGSDNLTILELNNKLGDLTSGLTLEIPNWTEKSTYLISFDYDTYGDDFVFSFTQKSPNDSVKKFVNQSYFEKRLNAQNFKTNQSIVFAEAKSIGGFLKIIPFSPKNASKIQIKNLIVKKITYPKLIFKKIVTENGSNQKVPDIIFRKVNPTRYLINVKGATNPYALVFLETFSKNWKLFNPESNTNSFKGEIVRFTGQIGKSLVSLFVKDNSPDSVVASYFDNKVKEEASTNTFLDSKTFDTWGKNTIVDGEQILVDGYANAWYINPEDMGGKTDYTLILELKAQKKFYPALLISLITVVFLLFYSVKRLLWPKK